MVPFPTGLTWFGRDPLSHWTDQESLWCLCPIGLTRTGLVSLPSGLTWFGPGSFSHWNDPCAAMGQWESLRVDSALSPVRRKEEQKEPAAEAGAPIVIAATLLLLLHFSAYPVAPSSVCSILVLGFVFRFGWVVRKLRWIRKAYVCVAEGGRRERGSRGDEREARQKEGKKEDERSGVV